MTVRILTDIQKHVITDLYLHGHVTVKELARSYHCSPRTVKRALVELGVTPVWERKPKVVTPVSQHVLAVKPGFPMYATQQSLDLRPMSGWSKLKATFSKLFSNAH